MDDVEGVVGVGEGEAITDVECQLPGPRHARVSDRCRGEDLRPVVDAGLPHVRRRHELQSFQGAVPPSQSELSRILSRIVSMHCQKP